METGNEDVDAFIRAVEAYLVGDINAETIDSEGIPHMWPLGDLVIVRRVNVALGIPSRYLGSLNDIIRAIELAFINEDTRLLFEEKFKDKIKFSRPSKYTPDRRIWTRIELSNLV